VAVLLGDTVWEGVSTETKPDDLTGGRDGHFFKELDTGETYVRLDGAWEYVNLGLAFVKATKSGRATTDGSGVTHIAFTTPFIDDQYSIALSCQDPGGGVGLIAYFANRTAAGFDVYTRRAAGTTVPNIPISWLATRDYDP
jgi:hypothetical protein